MSWETRLFCGISFKNKTYNNKYEVENDLEDLKACIKTCEQELRDLAIMTEPEKFMSKEYDNSPYSFVCQTVNDNIELLKECSVEKAQLELLLNEWDNCHDQNGLAIPPEEYMWNEAYLDGDSIKTIKNSSSNDLYN